MEMFSPIFNQMLSLFTLIIIGFILSKWKFVPDDSAKVLSKIENTLFVPALILFTFINKCNVSVLSEMWKLLLFSCILWGGLFCISAFVVKKCFKQETSRKIALHALGFCNFGFMGNAIMNAVFPEIFFEYTVFTLPFWIMSYVLAPALLIGESGGKQTLAKRVKTFFNPMIVAVIVGLFLGLTGWGLKLPKGILSVMETSGNCMSPIAMLFTGLTLGQTDLKELLKRVRLYVVAFVKVIVYPLLFVLIFMWIPQNEFVSVTFLKCALCICAMPTGMGAIVIPVAYGKDSSDAAGLALISHVLSILTIPLMFMLLQAAVL